MEKFISRFLAEFIIVPWNIKIQQGAFGTIYKVKIRSNGDASESTVVKLVEGLNDAGDTVTYSFKEMYHLSHAVRESHLLTKLTHPNIVQIFESWIEQAPPGYTGYPNRKAVGSSDGVLFIHMEFANLGSLDNWLDADWRCYDDELDPTMYGKEVYLDRLKLMNQITTGLKYLHDNKIIHRDLKPANILLKTEGERVLVKIADFGLATESRTKMTSRVGTCGYRSPEVAKQGGNKYSEKADIYSLGIIFWEILVCMRQNAEDLHYQFKEGITKEAKEASQLLSSITWKLTENEVDLVASMIAFDSDERASCRDILLKLNNISDGIAAQPLANFDETLDQHCIIGNPEDFVINILPSTSKCRNLKILILCNVMVDISLLMNVLEMCEKLEDLGLTISHFGESCIDSYRHVALPSLRKFKFHNNSEIHGFTNVCQISEEIVLKLLFFASSTDQLIKQMVKNRMEVKFVIRSSDVVRIDVDSHIFAINDNASSFLTRLLLQEPKFKDICIYNIDTEIDLDLQNLISRQALSCEKLELYNTPRLCVDEGLLLQNFESLSYLCLDGKSLVSARSIINLHVLPKRIDYLILENFILKLSDKNECLSFEQLVIKNCDLESDFAQKYSEVLQVGELSIISEDGCEDGVIFVPNFDLVLAVMNTTWRIMRFHKFEWTNSSQEDNDPVEALKNEEFRSILPNCDGVEIVGENCAITTVSKYEYRDKPRLISRIT